jgi:hypothetical protein
MLCFDECMTSPLVIFLIYFSSIFLAKSHFCVHLWYYIYNDFNLSDILHMLLVVFTRRPESGITLYLYGM